MANAGALSFCPNYYLRLYPDVAAVFGTNAIQHFTQSGKNEGRSPSPLFIPEFYIRKYPDVKDIFGLPGALNHWIRNGINEGRQGGPFFDPKFYLSCNSDVAAAFGESNYSAAYTHWIDCGIKEKSAL